MSEPTASDEELRLRDVRALRGASIWSPAPVVACRLEMASRLESAATAAAACARRVAAALGASAAPERSRIAAAPGASWGETLARVAYALQAAADSRPTFAWAVAGGPRGAEEVAVGYEEEALGLASLHAAAALLRACLRGRPPELEPVLVELRGIYRDARPGLTTMILLEAARRRGIPVRRSADDPLVQLGMGRNLRRIDASMTDLTSVIATDITSDKDRTKRILARVGIPVPRGAVASTLDEALGLAAELGTPVLLKPLNANEGRGISGRIDSEEGLRAAWPVAAAESPRVVVERYVEGRDHRVVVVAGRVVAVAERIPAHVVGDGRQTIRQLAEEVNREPNRDPYSPRAMRAPLPLDPTTERFLARRGYTLDTVPAAGEWVQLRATANLSTGGTAIDRTDEIHPRNAALCVLAAGAVGLDVAGLDVLTPDVSVPFRESGAVIIEVNASPGLRMHTDPDQGAPRDVPGAILDMLYPPGSDADIPVVAVTGGAGTSAAARLVAHLLGHAGRAVGLATTGGVYVQDALLIDGGIPEPDAAHVLLSHPQVEVAVLESTGEGILRWGAGFSQCGVGVVLDAPAERTGSEDGGTRERLTEAAAAVVAAVKPDGRVVLSADDPVAWETRERTAAEVTLFSAVRERGDPVVAGHLAGGGVAVLLEAGELVVLRDGRREVVTGVAELRPALQGGGGVDLRSILAAIAAADAVGMTPSAIRAGLLSLAGSGAGA